MDFDFKEPTLRVHELVHGAKTGRPGARDELEKAIADGCMHGLRVLLVERGILPPDPGRTDMLLRRKEEQAAEAERQCEDGDDRAAGLRMAEFYCRAMDMEKGFEAMGRIARDDASLSLRMDIGLCKIRMGLLAGSRRAVESGTRMADDAYERGCDWDRRNRYKIYKGLFRMMERRFREAGELFSEALPSFESSEVMSYGQAVRYMVLCGLLGFERAEVEARILKCSEVVGSSETLGVRLAGSLFECNYGEFMQDLHLFCTSLRDDVFGGRFVDLFSREMRLRAYGQVLESYRSMLLENMATTFGVSVEYVERDLGAFIVEGRLWGKIDRVSGVVEVVPRHGRDVSSVIARGADVVRRIKKCVK